MTVHFLLIHEMLINLISGEQVKIELIQINEEYTRGRILAKYESSAHSFLFPENNEQIIEMNRSHKYKCPPCVHITTTLTVSDTFIQSPVPVRSQYPVALSIQNQSNLFNDPASRLIDTVNSTQDKIQNVLYCISNKDTTSYHDVSSETHVCSPKSLHRNKSTNLVRKRVSFPTETKGSPNIKQFSVSQHDKTEFYEDYSSSVHQTRSKTRSPQTSTPNTSHTCIRRKTSSLKDMKPDIVSKYLVQSPDNSRKDDIMSPSLLIQDKVQKMIDKYNNEEDVDSIGDTSISEEIDHIRRSFATEREDSLNRTAQYIPDDSLLTKLGPKDYWSRKLSEFTGKPHRIVFDETMEKIYNRLYQHNL